ncbi:MAG: ABC transporter ATP-binding protein [Lachnospiraceae bacterium]
MKRESKQKQEQRDKLSIGRMLSNVKFIIRFAWENDPVVVLGIYAAFLFCPVVYAVYSTYFLKYFIQILQNRQINMLYTVLYIIAGMVLLIIAGMVEDGVENWAQVRFLKINGTLQRRFFEKAADIDLICYDNKEYYDDFVVAASQMEEMMLQGILSTGTLFGEALGILTLASLIFSINPVIALFPIAGFIINILTRFKITELEYHYEVEYKRIMRKADYSRRVFYQPEYAKEIKLSEVQVPLKSQFDEAVSEVMGEAHTIGIKIAVLSLINWIFTFTVFSYFCVPVYLGYLALVKRKIGLSDAAAMMNAEEGVRNNLDGINYALVRFQKVGQFAERFRRFVDYEIQIEKHQGSKAVPEGKQLLELRDISFRYEGAKKDTLKHISMTIRPGERVAFVGENGAGKTTLVKLLMRLYDVTDGQICYGGNDIREYTTKEYRDRIGAVFQDYQIYGATLAENVMMDDVAKEDGQRVSDALRLADFGEKLESLPDGIETNMTREFREDGTMLSGGEAQKVAIARMFAKKGDLSLAILDEPSSALDPLAEYTLNRNMMENAQNATIIFISHRLSTTRDADRIYMFEHGEIVEQGTHEELMAAQGKYAAMFEKQARYYQDEIAGEL